jgi:Tfp pilus assembly protein PilN
MKAVNLIPVEERRGGGAVSRSGGGAYLVLGTLAALVLMMGVYAFEGGKIGTKQAEASQANSQAQAIEAKASTLSEYADFADLKNKRIETVSSLAKSRFDWANTLHNLARVIPPNTWLVSLRGTVNPAVSVEGGGGGSSSVRSAVQAPAIEISGCTTSQPAVARMMARMRLIDNVDRVTLTSSEKNDSTTGAAGDSASGSGDCTGGSDEYPKFELVVFFDPITTATGQTAAATPAATPATTTPAAGQ